MAREQTTEGTRVIHTPAGMHRPPAHGEAADGADIASTDMSVDPGGSRADPLASEPHGLDAAGVPADLAARLLEVLDDIERLTAGETSAQALRAGLGAVEGRLRAALAAAGLERSSGVSRVKSTGDVVAVASGGPRT